MSEKDLFVEDYFNEDEDDTLDGVEYEEELDFDEDLYQQNLKENKFHYKVEGEGIGE